MSAPFNQGLHRFAVFTACSTFLLLVAGALVTSNDAGLSVPDWPLSYGSILPPMVGGIFWEHGHRMIAAFVGILTIVLAVWLWRSEPRPWVRRLGLGALGLIVAQGVLGGLTVHFYLPAAISTAHATLAQLFFATVISLALFSGEWWQSETLRLEDSGSPSLRLLAVLTSLAILLQIILGAAFRHNGFGIVPHLVGAGVVTVMVVWTGRVVRKRFAKVKLLRRGVIWLHAFYGLQILLGGVAYGAVLAARNIPQPLPWIVVATVLHVVVGALLFATSVLLALSCYRLSKPSAVLSAPASADRAAI
jgi:cytochrome c oxidase assembly protein subunit 15